MTASASYLQICIPAPEDGLSGTVVADWIEYVVSTRDLAWVASSDVDVAGDARAQLSIGAHGIRVMLASELLSLIRRATQVVWASLFFCRTESDAKMVQSDEAYEVSTAKAIVTVRVVDASYVYFIGREDVLWGVQDLLPPGERRIGAITDMEFPE